MPKKIKNNLDDNFSLDTGGMSEFFPLEKPSKDTKAPKGKKGYLKNVAKSVLNLGVKVNKHLYPEVFDMAEAIGIGSNNENKINVKGILANVNNEVKKWSGVGKDVVKEVVKDTKEAVKTGYFVKTEDEEMDMSSMFGDVLGDDFDFNGDSVSYDNENNFSLDDSDFGLSDDNSSGAKLNLGEAVVKSEYASTRALIGSNAKMMNATLSATQAHIKNENMIFAQQMSVLQEQHVEKMGVLRNIAVNIGKNIEQGNISLRAQMEYSAKSLAFAQDTAAMIKELRDSIWEMSKPKEINKTPQQSLFSKVFGNGSSLNIKEWGKYWKQNTKSQAAGGAFDMIGSLPEMIGTMTEMGMTPAQAIKSLGGSMIRDSIVDAFIGSDTRKKINAFNVGMRSLPGAINAKLGELGNDPSKISDLINQVPILNKLVNKFDKNGKVAEFLSNQASYAHMYDNSTVLSDRYVMGDPNAVHPFDNKAHKVLTEVIPYQLSEINAGVNHKEAEYFDFKLNKFMPKSYMKTITEQNERNVVKGNFGYSDLENSFSTRVTDFSNLDKNIRKDLIGIDINTLKEKDERRNDAPFYDSNGQLITEMITSEFDRMLANFHKFQLPWNKESVKKIKSDDNYRDLILMGTSLELTSDELKKIAVKLFADTLDDQMTITGPDKEEKAERNRYLRAGGLSYASDLTNMYSENEDRFAGMGSSIDYYSQMRNKDNKRELEKAEHYLAKMEKRYAENHSAANLKKLQEARQNVTELKQLMATTGYSGEVNANINKGFDVNSNTDFDFNNFRIKSLEDTSQYGLIQNIYNLLLSGIDVYPKKSASKDHEDFVTEAQKRQGENKQRSITAMNTFQKSTEYEEVGLGKDIKANLKDDGKDENGETKVWRMSDDYRFLIHHHYKYYEYDVPTGKYKAVSGTNFDDNTTYYKRVADIKAENTLTEKEQRMERTESFGGSFLQKIPVVNKAYGAVNKIYGGLTGFASKLLGEKFYGEDYGDESYKNDLDKAGKKVKDKVTETSENLKETGRKIKDYTKDVYEDAKEFNGKTGSGIDTGIHVLHRITRDLDEKAHISESIDKAKQLPNKIKAKIENIKKSDDTLYETLKKEFGEDKAIFKMIDEIEKEEKELWKDFKEDPLVTNVVESTNRMKDELFKKIENSKVFNKLDEKKKIVFNKIVTEERKARIKGWKNNIVKKYNDIINKVKSDEKLNSLIENGKNLRDSIVNSDKTKAAIGKAKDLKDAAKNKIDEVGEYAERYAQAFKDENVKETFEEDLEKTKKKHKGGFLKGIFRRDKEEDDGIINSSDEMKKDRESKKQEGLLGTIAAGIASIGAFFKKADKDGIELADKTMDKIDESNKEAAENIGDSISGSDGLLSSLLNKITGGKFGGLISKAGDIGKTLSSVGGTVAGAGGAVGGIGGALAGIGTKLSGIAGAAGSLSLGGAISGAKGLITKAGTKLAATGGAKGLIGRVGDLIKKIFDAIFKKGGGAVKKAGTKARDMLINQIKKHAPKLGTKLASVSAASATILLEVALIVAGFAKGMYKAKEYFKVGKGMRVSFGMKMAAGLGDALDSALMGIPGIICGLCGFPSVPLMFYEWCGGDAEKDALVRYRKYNELRSRILGIADPDALISFENRSQGEGVGGTIKNGLNKGFRAIGSFLTNGLMMDNEEKDASTLGFKTKEIFRKWKTEKYDPIDQMREQVANSLGFELKDVEDITSHTDAADMDENEDGQIDEGNEKAMKEMEALQNQAKYRTTYLKAAKEYVTSNGLEWLTSSCTPEEFAERTGKDAGKDIVTSKSERFKSSLKKWASRVTGVSAVKGIINTVKSIKTDGLVATTKKIKQKVEELFEKYKMGTKEKDMMNSATAAIQSVLKGVDPGFTEDAKINNDNPKGIVGTAGADTNSDVVNVGQNGGPGFAAGEGFYVRTDKQDIMKKTMSDRFSKPTPKTLPSITDTFDLSGKTPKALVMNSIADDFAKNFGNELNKKLDILKEIQEENIRHHGVAEDFFSVTLQLLSQMAKSSGNTKISSRLDSMVREVTSL